MISSHRVTLRLHSTPQGRVQDGQKGRCGRGIDNWEKLKGRQSLTVEELRLGARRDQAQNGFDWGGSLINDQWNFVVNNDNKECQDYCC